MCSAQNQQINSLESEIDNYKKSILKEEEKNEKLTFQHNKACADENHVRKQTELSEAKKNQLKTEYVTYTRILHETQQSLSRETTVCDTYWREGGGLFYTYTDCAVCLVTRRH